MRGLAGGGEAAAGGAAAGGRPMRTPSRVARASDTSRALAHCTPTTASHRRWLRTHRFRQPDSVRPERLAAMARHLRCSTRTAWSMYRSSSSVHMSPPSLSSGVLSPEPEPLAASALRCRRCQRLRTESSVRGTGRSAAMRAHFCPSRSTLSEMISSSSRDHATLLWPRFRLCSPDPETDDAVETVEEVETLESVLSTCGRGKGWNRVLFSSFARLARVMRASSVLTSTTAPPSETTDPRDHIVSCFQ
mmetsp:Transcript_1431/g.4997  ORF Transcript_1431/g.4997 Transcript_1431/m.4997 type:complete len:248 (+) Transcript_1431:137-880(+)